MLLFFGMINIETVLVLGAGASVDFGFPTGQQLVRDIYSLLDPKTGSYYDLYYRIARKQNDDILIERFPVILRKADPFSIDEWLEKNDEFIPMGKIAISIVLLHYELNSDLSPVNNWYRLLFKRLDGPFENFQNNMLSIITFNYERSLEKYLYDAFRYNHVKKSDAECVN